jgi:hypothetical protein
MANVGLMINQINSKIKHISVFNQEIAQVLLPPQDQGSK